MVRNCKASVMTLYGNTNIEFKTRAKTKGGILRACGKAIARQLHDDAIDVWGIEVDWPESETPFKTRYITLKNFADHDTVFKAAHDELFEVMYA